MLIYYRQFPVYNNISSCLGRIVEYHSLRFCLQGSFEGEEMNEEAYEKLRMHLLVRDFFIKGEEFDEFIETSI